MSLVILVAAFGPALVVADAWLDRRLPHPAPADRGVISGFAVVTFLGLILTALMVVPMYLSAPLRSVGLALVVVGLATLASWVRLSRAEPVPPWWLTLVGRVGVGVAVVAGLAVMIPEIQGALG